METGHVDIFLPGFTLLAAALVFVLIFRRFGLGAVLGYLIAGALIGPQMLGLVGDAQTIVSFAETGIVLLLFLVGPRTRPVTALAHEARHIRFRSGASDPVRRRTGRAYLSDTGFQLGRGHRARPAAGAVVDGRRCCRC